ncbi:hypothetical protein FNW52_14885 [Flavobacterium sp. ZT3R18]|uniref:hypothetical protein n=1 Tax=Flavobacterium sp. ZT3R18 TaxID=2594429 RepID=UPI001179F08F|nr:hypothetical protein [Flavobacterium sp. ZT3R18]TRX33711.1 hypothetical protein FNW52_14885 [Flavobacterium sp. ZT3R18]
MVKAHSLLYAIYICLIVSIICGAILFFSNLYGQLNLYYNLQEELYINNQSTVNFALENQEVTQEPIEDEKSGITGSYITRPYGLLNLLLVKSETNKDTIQSAHFIGLYTKDKTALFLANFSKPLTYTGTVKLIGDNSLPSTYIETAYINNRPNQLLIDGKNTISENQLPEINPNFKKIFYGIRAEKTNLSDVEKPKDSLYFNSFFNTTKEIYLNSNVSNVIFKGNFILRSKDSLHIKKNTVLEDVILIAPKITFESGFKGTVQAFASERIELEQNVILNYPSVLCIYNETSDESKIKIKKKCKITGSVVLFGNTNEMIDKNSIEIEEDGLLFGDIYCTGKLFLKTKVYGSVYTNRLFHKTESASYDNTISDIEINAKKRPNYFISIPIFDSKSLSHGIIKKVL